MRSHVLALVAIVAAAAAPVRAEPELEHVDTPGRLNFVAGVGSAFFGSDDGTPGKLWSASYSDDLPDAVEVSEILRWEVSIGTYNAVNVFNSSYTYFGSVGLGADVETASGIYARVSGGPAYVSKTDDRLGGRFQILTKVGLGLHSDLGRLGVVYQHLSNGGLTDLNYGRDYVGVEISIPAASLFHSE